MKRIFRKKGFSLIELSIVVLIIGLIIAGVIGGRKLISLSNLTKARQLTNSSPVNNIEDLVLWMEATSKGSFLPTEGIDGSPISQWNDINPQSNVKKNATQSNTARQPAYIASSVINSLPAIRFDGSNDYLATSTLTPNLDLSNNSQITIFVVLNMTSSDGTDMFLFTDNGSGSSRIVLDSFYWDMPNTSTGRLTYNTNNAAFSALGNMIYTATKNSSTQYLYLNGKLDSSKSNSLTLGTYSAPLYIGAGDITNGTVFFSHTDIGELIIFSRALSDFERAEVEQYLSKKWGIKLS